MNKKFYGCCGSLCISKVQGELPDVGLNPTGNTYFFLKENEHPQNPGFATASGPKNYGHRPYQ